MSKNIYPEINSYLSDVSDKESRCIKKEVLQDYKVGVGSEKFRNDYD